MKKLLIFSIFLLAAGCGFAQRLDAIHDELANMSAKLDETNRALGNVEKSTSKLAKVVP
jgi:hypothetical protein